MKLDVRRLVVLLALVSAADVRAQDPGDRVAPEMFFESAHGYEDVFITASMNYPFRYGINTLLLNNRGETFLDSEFILGVEPRDELVKP